MLVALELKHLSILGETITPGLVNYNGNNPYGSAAEGTLPQTNNGCGEFFTPMLLDFMICTGMFGNGALLATKIEAIARCGVAVPGTTAAVNCRSAYRLSNSAGRSFLGHRFSRGYWFP
jgi:hypothetical protein